MDQTRVSDFFGWYPEISDPEFNSYLSRKVEFSELEPQVKEPPPKRGFRYNHQEFGVRFSTWYDRLLVLHEPGTGKSCLLTGIAELFHQEYLKSPDDPTKIKKAIVIVRAPALKENIRNEIVCKCTDRVYETQTVSNANDEKALKKHITSELKKWYEIMTFRRFAKIINSLRGSEELNNYMSNKVFLFDEGHNAVTIKEFNTINDDTLLYDEEDEQDIDPSIEAGSVDDDIEDEDEELDKNTYEGAPVDVTVYRTIHRAFHAGQRNKVFIFTATPMINSPKEFPLVMNLILPLEMQMPLWTEDEINEIPFETMEPYLRGRVSYIRALDSGARKVYVGEVPEGTESTIYFCDMSEYQYAIYLNAAVGQRLFTKQLQASNFVFPDASYGVSGWRKFVEAKPQGQYIFRNDPNGQMLAQSIRDPIRFQQMSAKFYEIVRICQASYPPSDPSQITDDHGIVFVYFPQYVEGSGSILCGLCLQEYGYELYRENFRIFTGSGVPGGRISACGDSFSSNQVDRQARIPKKRRCAVLSSRTTRAQFVSLIDTLTSYENRFGEYIQTVIISRVGQEGISINHAAKEIMSSSPWSYARRFQAENRVFRNTSHDVRIAFKKEQMRLQGKPQEEIDNVVFDVKVYNMASVYPGNPNASQEPLRNEDIGTVDTKMYLLTERKDRMIRRILRFCKRASIDCYINYKRNVRPGDVDGSQICDYESCHYECAGIRRDILNKVDRTTKMLYYSEPEINQAIKAISTLFSNIYSIRIEQLVKSIPDIEPIFIHLALETMIRDNVRVTNRLGFFGYLRDTPGEDALIYLESDRFVNEKDSGPLNALYTSSLIGVQDPRNNVFADYVSGREATDQRSQIDVLLQTDPSQPQFTQLLETLALSNKVLILEQVLTAMNTTGQSNIFYDAILTAFQENIFNLSEPIGLINQATFKLNNKGQKRGRKPKTGGKRKPKAIELDFNAPGANETGQRVIIHNLTSQNYDRTGYNIISKYFKVEGRLRLFKPTAVGEEKKWRDLNQVEQIVYNLLIQQKIQDILNVYEQFSIYGIMIPPLNKFHIRDRENEDREASRTNKKLIREGKICVHWTKPELLDLLYRLNLAPGPISMLPGTSRETLIQRISGTQGLSGGKYSEFPDNKLLLYSAWLDWLGNDKNLSDICNVIQNYFQQTGRIYTGRMSARAPGTPNNIIQVETGEEGDEDE